MLTEIEFKVLKDAITQLEKHTPSSALNLAGMALGHSPSEQWFKAKYAEISDYIAKRSGYVLTARHDGTTERLNAVVHGFALAIKYQLEFKFSWATDLGSIHNDLISITNELPGFYSRSFIENYYITFQEMRTYKLTSYMSTPAEYISGFRYSKLLSQEQLKDILDQHCNLVGPERFLDSALIKEELKVAMSTIFPENYKSEFTKLANTIPSEAIGIHYRGGDVIFGMSRHDTNGVWGKSFSLPLVEHLIQKHQSDPVVIFGTPIGDSLEELNHLKDKYKHVQLGHEIGSPDIDGVVSDAFKMSCCSKVYNAGNSGVPVLANNFSLVNDRTVEFLTPTEKEQLQILDKSLSSPEFSNYKTLQKSFVHIQLYMLCKGFGLDQSKKDNHLSAVRELDPANRMEWL